jgi:hypothetical protein
VKWRDDWSRANDNGSKRYDMKLESGPRISLTIQQLRNATTFARVVARMLRRIEKKNEGILGEDQFGFIRGKGTGDAIGMLRITIERTFDTDAELCACFIDRQNAYDRINADPKEHWH